MPSTDATRSAARSARVPPPLSRWAVVGLGVALAFFTATALLSYVNQRRFTDAEHAATRTQLLASEVSELVSDLHAAETAQRAYLLAHRDDLKQAYHEALREAREQLRDMQSLEVDPADEDDARRLVQTAAARVEQLERTVTLAEQDDPAAVTVAVAEGTGRELMARLRSDAAEVLRREELELQAHRDNARRATRIIHITDLFAAALGLGLAAIAFARLRHEFLARDQAARDLEDQRELLQVTLESIGDAVVTTDGRGNVRSLNAVAERLLGWTGDEAAGRPVGEVLKVVDEQTRSPVESPALRALRESQPARYVLAALLIARDNTERRIESSASPIRTADGRVLGAVLTFRDVTDRKRAEDALRRSEERLRRALQASRMVAWEIDVASEVVVRSENAAELLGLPRFGPVSEFTSLIDPEDRPAVEAALARAMRGESAYSVECQLQLPDGRRLWAVDKGDVRRNDRGEPTHVVGMMMDLTELKRAEQELREADRRKDRFLATLAHELRNPLAPISNALQAWPYVKDDPAELERLRETMVRQVAQMTRLIEDLLDVSRITRGKIAIKKERIELRAILDAAIEGVRPLIDARKHTLHLSVPTPGPTVEGDTARLVQVFTNLLQNAAKYTDEGGRIELAARVDGDGPDGTGRAVVSVSDNGAGIPPAMLSRIFDMFAQVDQTLDRSHGGLGIGLTLVKNLVELHGGTVTAESEGRGRGSTFRVSLPLAAPTPEATPPEPQAAPDRLPSLRMLVVDDVPPAARTLALMLKGIGQETRVAHDGVSALTAVDEFRPDVVLLDIAMPGMDGYEVCRRLRERFAASPKLRPLLVALTGYGQEEDRRRAFEAGFDRHLVKPTSMDDLKALLAGAARSGDGR